MKTFHTVCFRKPDLDTLVSAWLAGVNPGRHKIIPLTGNASAEMLNDPATLCLECGGSGQVNLANFDHHGPGEALPTAAEQAFTFFAPRDAVNRYAFSRDLTYYTAWVDSAGERGLEPPKAEVTLSGLLSAQIATANSTLESFMQGLTLIAECAASGLPPWDLEAGLSRYPRWQTLAAQKARLRRELSDCAAQVCPLDNRLGPGLSLRCSLPGVHGLLRDMGGKVRLALCPGTTLRCTISVDGENKSWLQKLLLRIGDLEQGWGGPANGCIIGSPFAGSHLSEREIRVLISNL
jgi:hypothetical protein